MTQVTVKQLADEVKTPVERLLQQMREAGLPHTAADEGVSDSEKQSLLTHLKSSHKAKVEEPRKITLQRKTTSTLRVAGSKSISVEVRKKKVFVQRSPEEIEAERKRELEERRAVENAARQKAEEEAKRRAEEEARRQPAAAQPAATEAVAAPSAPVEAVREAAPVAAAAIDKEWGIEVCDLALGRLDLAQGDVDAGRDVPCRVLILFSDVDQLGIRRFLVFFNAGVNVICLK